MKKKLRYEVFSKISREYGEAQRFAHDRETDQLIVNIADTNENNLNEFWNKMFSDLGLTK